MQLTDDEWLNIINSIVREEVSNTLTVESLDECLRDIDADSLDTMLVIYGLCDHTNPSEAKFSKYRTGKQLSDIPLRYIVALFDTDL
jgi:hypothetical protein